MRFNLDPTKPGASAYITGTNGTENKGPSVLRAVKVNQEIDGSVNSGFALVKNTWTNRPFNKIEYNNGLESYIDTGSPSAGWVKIVPSGTYLITAWAVYGIDSGANILRLRDGNGTVLAISSPGYSSLTTAGLDVYNTSNWLVLKARLVFNTLNTLLYLDHWCEGAGGGLSGGASGFTSVTNNVLAFMEITKVT